MFHNFKGVNTKMQRIDQKVSTKCPYDKVLLAY